MLAKEILTNICDIAIKDGGASLEYALQQSFNEYESIKLLKKRALLSKHCEDVLEDIGYDKDMLNDVLKVIAHKNLNTKMEAFKDVLNTTQKHLINSIFAHYEMKNKVYSKVDIDSIAHLETELEKEINEATDISSEKRQMLLGFCKIIKEAHEESEVVGAKAALAKLHILFTGRLVIYSEELRKIKDHRLFERLRWLYANIEAANKIIKTLKEFGTSLLSIIN